MGKANRIPLNVSAVFLRIPDYGKKPVSEQARLRAQLDTAMAVAVVGVPPRDRAALEVADGGAMVFLRDPAGALQFAERVLAAAEVGLPLCVGLNHGPVRIGGGQEGGEGGLTGDGIATAANIAGFSSPGQLLAARSFRDALFEAAPGLASTLRPAGVHSDAGLRTHELYSTDRPAAMRRRRRLLAAGALTALAVMGGAIAVRVSGPSTPAGTVRERLRGEARRGTEWLRGLTRRDGR